MTTEQSTLGSLLRKRREALGLTQREVAQAFGIKSPEFIGMLETGYRQVSLDTVPKLAGILNLDAGDLCRLALRENHPNVYISLFGNDSPPEEIRESSAMADSASRLFALDRPHRIAIEHLINTLYESQRTDNSTPRSHR